MANFDYQSIIRQLGGNRFFLTTGSKNLLYSQKENWLRMDLTTNKSGATRLKITLMPDDTYTMYFYRMTNKRGGEVAITKEATYEMVYDEQLPVFFTSHTGLIINVL